MRRHLRFSTVAMIALLLLPVAAHAAEFRCGKKFVTFTHHAGTYNSKSYPAGPVTIPKKDVLFVASTSPHAALLMVRVGKGALSRNVGEKTRRRIVKCLN